MKTYEITTKDSRISRVECDFVEETDEGVSFYINYKFKDRYSRRRVGKVKREDLGDIMEIDND